MKRLFVAIEIPEDIRDRLAGLQGGIPGARWVAHENFHLTLRFIGEVDGGTAQDIVDSLSGLRGHGFDMTLNGIGHFETKGRVRAVWAGVEANPALTALQRKVDSALAGAGIEPEGRKFRPHVTLARLKDASYSRISDFVAARSLFRTLPFPVEHVTLFQSRLGGEGPVYRPMLEIPLILPLNAGAGDAHAEAVLAQS